LIWDKYQDAVRVAGDVAWVARSACVRTEGQHTTALCTHLSFVSTDKGFKGFEMFIKNSSKLASAVPPSINPSLTGHVYRGFHFIPFNISALQSFQPWMY
jgi:hypothetical protein